MATKADYTPTVRGKRAKLAHETGVGNDLQDAEAMVRQILGRVHVGASYLSAVRAVMAAVKGGWPALKRRLREQAGDQTRVCRRHFLRLCLWIHLEHRQTYEMVMSGRF